jgi:hypothetical protein
MAEIAATVKIEFTQDEVRLLYERNVALTDALRALVAVEPTVHNAQGVVICSACRKREPWEDRLARRRPFVHAPECPWTAARALLAEKGEGNG